MLMRKTTRILLSTLLALLTLLASVAPLFRFHSYLSDPAWTDADIIRHYHGVRLVQPEWVRPHPSLLMNWTICEIQARAFAVGLLWLGAIAISIGVPSRRPKR